MHFAWTQEQDERYNDIVRLVGQKLNLCSVATECWTRTEWQLCGELGLLGLSVPEQYGGSGLDALTSARMIEAFGYASENMGLVFSVSAHLFSCAMPIVEYGEPDLKDRLLAEMCSSHVIGANAITEREAGSDVFGLKTSAIREGNDYILNGQKSYVSNGPVADLFVVYAITNSSHGYLGLSGFVVERGTPGLVLSQPFHKMGLDSTPACQISLEGCRIPATNRLGKEGEGSQIFKRSMQWERSCLFAAYLGQMQRQLERTVIYARERRQFGKPIGKNQAIAHRIADMKLRLESARLLLYRACWLFDQDEDAVLDISLSKLAVSEAAIRGGLDAIHIHGSAGFDREYGIERMLRDAIPGEIFSGTSEMQRDIIANSLGL